MKTRKELKENKELIEDWRSVLSQAEFDNKIAREALVEIQKWQFDHVELARSTPVYKIAEKVVGDYCPESVRPKLNSNQ